MKPLYIIASLALVCSFVLSACTTTQSLTRLDQAEALELSNHWERRAEREDEAILFAVEHPGQGVQARLHRLPIQYLPDALPFWALAWALEQFEEVQEISIDGIGAPDEQIRRLKMVAIDGQGAAQGFEFRLFNQGPWSYLLELWGLPEVMEGKGSAMADELSRGILFNAIGAGTRGAEEHTSLQTELEGLRLTLEAPTWRVSIEDEAFVSFALDAHLIEGRVLVEALPYPITAARYAAIATRIEHPIEGVQTIDSLDVIEAVGGPIKMTRHRRFITSGLRGYQIVIWTPEALYEQNRRLIDAVLDSIEVD